jgi:C1A family cysteine protease
MPSRMFIWYYGRLKQGEGFAQRDTGMFIRDGLMSLNTRGVCSEQLWRYDVSILAKNNKSFQPTNCHAASKPSKAAHKEALNHAGISYHSLIQNLKDMRHCLDEGFPFVCGINIYDYPGGIYSIKDDNILRMPPHGQKPKFKGGHGVMVVGYDDETKRFIVRNSWGTKWADGGYFEMPYAYLTDKRYAYTFWTIRLAK